MDARRLRRLMQPLPLSFSLAVDLHELETVAGWEGIIRLFLCPDIRTKISVDANGARQDEWFGGVQLDLVLSSE